MKRITSKSYKNPLKAQEEDVEALEPWMVNDLCRTSEGNSDAIIYRVIDVHDGDWNSDTLTLKPVHGLVTDIKNERCLVIEADYCKKLSLLDLAGEYATFGTFIANETKRRNTDPPHSTDIATRVSTWDDGDVARPGTQADDGSGLCTDISARDEA